MIRIADRVWKAWRAQAEQFDEWSIEMLLSCSGPPELAVRSVDEAMRDMHDAYRSSDTFPGEWAWMRTDGGVILKVAECEDFESVLAELVGGLERRGVEGNLDVYRRRRISEQLPKAPVLECRLLVNGERIRRAKRNYGWIVDPDALAGATEAAVRWCLDEGRRGAVGLKAGVLPALPLLPGENVVGRVIEAIGPATTLLRVWTLAPGERRCVSLHPFTGRVSLVEQIKPGDWRASLDGLTDVLRANANTTAYGFIKHGSRTGAALQAQSLTHDWPPRPGIPPGDRRMGNADVFANTHAPDAFAVQLLGSGYAGRVPNGPSWRRHMLGDESVLLAHVDPDAWFDTEFVGPGSDAVLEAQAPPVLAHAREDLDPILFVPGLDLA